MAEKKPVFECGEIHPQPPPHLPREIALFLCQPRPPHPGDWGTFWIPREARHADLGQRMVEGTAKPPFLARSPSPGSPSSNSFYPPPLLSPPIHDNDLSRAYKIRGIPPCPLLPSHILPICPSPCTPATLPTFHLLEPEVQSPTPGPLHIPLLPSNRTTMPLFTGLTQESFPDFQTKAGPYNTVSSFLAHFLCSP